MKSVELRVEVLNLRQSCLGTHNIHEKHLFRLENIVGVNPSLWLHSQLMLKTKQTCKIMDCDLTLPPVDHAHKLLCIGIKVKSGVELTDDLSVPVVLKAHHLGHLQLITSGFDLVEDSVTLSSHPLPIYPLGLHHGCLLVKVDGPVPIQVEIRPKTPVRALLATIIHRSAMGFLDCSLLGLL
jgi:hypothetical protein